MPGEPKLGDRHGFTNSRRRGKEACMGVLSDGETLAPALAPSAVRRLVVAAGVRMNRGVPPA